MHTQHDLFRPMCGETSARQGRLFDDDGPTDSALSCGECGEAMTHTPSGYLCCPNGHGKLLAAETDDGDQDGGPGGLFPGQTFCAFCGRVNCLCTP